jgi:endogenous inhibitor of DNA gyrase (YacG/DUF329 family)
MMAYQCPICQKTIPPTSPAGEATAYLPFCSKRCKLVDLNAWFEADYRIEAPLTVDDNEDIPSGD